MKYRYVALTPSDLETDDDNVPHPSFWAARRMKVTTPVLNSAGWVNVYRYFTDALIWPRGLALDAIHDRVPSLDSPVDGVDCPIQQGLADGNPDVDAIYRLTLPLPKRFRSNACVALGSGSWCPFNSQNTSWWPKTYPLLYLPSHCSFRMTDIWRSFVAQRIAWVNGWSVLFRGPDVSQERNPHDLMRDFQDELPGYLHNRAICSTLEQLELKSGGDRVSENLHNCYTALIHGGWIKSDELDLLNAWLEDIAT